MQKGPAAYIVVVLLEAALCSIVASSADMSSAILVRVDQSGRGDYAKIQDAIDSVPSGNSELYFISVNPGVYREKIVVPGDKPFITLSGKNAGTTIITWSDGGDIFESPTFSVVASDFDGRNLTIQNGFGPSGKGVALRVSGDRAAFYSCRILSYQDTLLDDTGNHYYSNCYIEGGTDFICGSAASLFEKCHLHSITQGNGAITAQKRQSSSEKSGFIFVGCNITGTKTAYLGRPWGAYSTVVFALSFMPREIHPHGWEDWRDYGKRSTVYYGEYKCYGPGADTEDRVEWSRSLSSHEAATFLTKEIIGGGHWLRPVPIRFRRPPAFFAMNDTHEEN